MKNKPMLVFLLTLCAAAFIAAPVSFAVEDEEELYPTMGRGDEYAVEEAVLRAADEADKLQMSFSASVTGGYDTNIKLEHYDAVASFFIQQAFGARAKYRLYDSLSLTGEYDITSIKYTRNSDPDLLDNVISAGLEAKIAEDLLWSLDYIVDFVRFPHDKESEYTTNGIETALRHDITDRFYQKAVYRFSHSHYRKLKTRNNNGTRLMGDREDARNTLEHQLGFYLNDRTFLRADNSLFLNNSNDPFLDYYDYNAFKTKGMILYLITEKLYALANVGYQYKTYKNRIVSDQVHGDQRDHLLMGGASLFYDIIPSVSIGTSFDYRKNFSNENLQNYTDYIISGGAYCRF